MLFRLHEKGEVTWITHIKWLPCSCGFGHVCFFGCGMDPLFLKASQKRLRDCFSQDWVSHGRVSDRFA